MQLSKKQKTFSQFSAAFLKSASNFEHFEKKNQRLIAYVYPKSQIANNFFRWMLKKPHFRTPFNSQCAKGSQTLLKSARQYFYHIL